MTLVAICGDWHGDANFANATLLHLHHKGIGQILHCGDFGYGWDRSYIPSVQKVLARNGQLLRFVPGNHENYDLIEQLYERDAQWLDENIYVMRRGERLTLANTEFVGIGGAHSIDKDMRRPHVSWWPQELLTYGDVRRILEQPQCDVVIAHDAPISADLGLRLAYKCDPITESNRKLLQIAVDHLRPRYLFHGHYHQRHSTRDSNDVVVVGLSHNYDKREDNYVIFDTVEKTIVD